MSAATTFDPEASRESRVLVSRHGSVMLVTLNRPEARNAIDAATASAVSEAFDAAELDDEIGAVVITGAGSTFCAGADVKELAAGRSVYVPGRRDLGLAGITRREFAKPVIAAVNGPALGGGLEIALASDLILAAQTARFGLPEIQRGVLASEGGAVRLPSRIPVHKALEAGLTGQAFTAEEAWRMGLVNRIIDANELVDHALDLANTIASRSREATAAVKKVMWAASKGSPDESSLWSLNDELTRAILDNSTASGVFATVRVEASMPDRESSQEGTP